MRVCARGCGSTCSYAFPSGRGNARIFSAVFFRSCGFSRGRFSRGRAVGCGSGCVRVRVCARGCGSTCSYAFPSGRGNARIFSAVFFRSCGFSRGRAVGRRSLPRASAPEGVRAPSGADARSRGRSLPRASAPEGSRSRWRPLPRTLSGTSALGSGPLRPWLASPIRRC